MAGQASVTLTDQADGYVIADALRFEPLTTTTQHAGLYYLHTDHLGTPQLVTDEDQKTVWQADYAPFGEATVTKRTRGLVLPFAFSAFKFSKFPFSLS
jgi:uncharacterized protein RhaS with RHS repeats